MTVKARDFTPVEAARAVAKYFPADPAVWLERAALAGVEVTTDGDGLQILWLAATDPQQVTFLNCWLNLTPGGDRAVAALLAKAA